MSTDASYLRCRHCRGFYETAFARCKWCDYDDPVRMPGGQPRIYPNRETCRAVQIAEYEQLPDEAHRDCFGPPAQQPELRCKCLHCGEQGQIFEAIEMRWMKNERMWACPCTTCGGRGLNFDIHPVDFQCQCEECHHFFNPAGGEAETEQACPQCGSRAISGWFDDADEEDLPEDEELFEDEEIEEPEDPEFAETAPWSENAFDEDEPEELESGSPGHWIEDDIDHPRPPRDPSDGPRFNPGDINPGDIPF